MRDAHDVGAHGPKDSGLQPERTALAWTRTSLAIVLSGAVLLFKEVRGVDGAVRLGVVGLGVVIALIAYRIGMRRQQTLSTWPLPAQVTARREVHLIGSLVLVLIVISSVVVFV